MAQMGRTAAKIHKRFMTPEEKSANSGSNQPLTAMSDAELVLCISDANKAAFAEFFGRYSGRVRGFLLKMGARVSDADELSQEVMVTVWRKAAMFDPDRAQVSTWLFTIARNRWIDTLRKHARPEPDPNDPMFQPPPEPDGAQFLSTQEREKKVRAAVAELTEPQREVLIAAFFRGLSQSEIAEELQLPMGTVKSRTRLAFARLRDVLGEDMILELRDD